MKKIVFLIVITIHSFGCNGNNGRQETHNVQDEQVNGGDSLSSESPESEEHFVLKDVDGANWRGKGIILLSRGSSMLSIIGKDVKGAPAISNLIVTDTGPHSIIPENNIPGLIFSVKVESATKNYAISANQPMSHGNIHISKIYNKNKLMKSAEGTFPEVVYT